MKEKIEKYLATLKADCYEGHDGDQAIFKIHIGTKPDTVETYLIKMPENQIPMLIEYCIKVVDKLAELHENGLSRKEIFSQIEGLNPNSIEMVMIVVKMFKDDGLFCDQIFSEFLYVATEMIDVPFDSAGYMLLTGPALRQAVVSVAVGTIDYLSDDEIKEHATYFLIRYCLSLRRYVGEGKV